MNVGYFSKANAATRRLGFKSTLHVFDAQVAG